MVRLRPEDAKRLAFTAIGAVTLASIVLAAVPGRFAAADPQRDWPTYRHDSGRSGYTPQTLDAAHLQLAWRWQSASPPEPAWYGPAKEDAYANIPRLPSMRGYDRVFHVTAVGGDVFFGSTADDTVYCLDAQNGTEKWTYVTDGPVRVAPTITEGRVYFGSDDGYAYCLDAQDGSLVWKANPAPKARRILNNGRLVSPWPCRTGLLVDRGVAYFANSMLPWKPSYLTAVDARTGRQKEAHGYCRTLHGMTMEGPLAASSEMLISPQGRVAPQMFRRTDGGSLGSLKGNGGGSIVVVGASGTIFHGPAGGKDIRKGGIGANAAATGEKIASYPHGTDIVIAGRHAYMLAGNTLGASDWIDKKDQWTTACVGNLALIVAGDAIYVGGEDLVAAYTTGDGRMTWRHPVDGKAYGLAVAGGRLLVSTDTGSIYSFQPGGETWKPTPPASRAAGHSTKVTGSAGPARGATLPHPASPGNNAPGHQRLRTGPWLRFAAPGKAVVRWRSSQPSPTVLRYWLAGTAAKTTITEDRPKTQHQVTIEGLKRNRVYRYQIERLVEGTMASTMAFELDTLFDYSVAAAPPVPCPYRDDESAIDYAGLAARILADTGVSQGLGLVVGCGKGHLAYELARQSRLRVIGVDTQRDKIEAARRALIQARLYGRRVAVHQVESYDRLNIPGELANLVVSERLASDGLLPGGASDLARLLKPGRGVAYLGQPAGAADRLSKNRLVSWLKAGDTDASVSEDADGLWAVIRRDPLPGTGHWSHLYGRADNSAYGGEQLAEVGSADQMVVQWIGRPGPRYQADRNGRKPSPLATNGRLFVQGKDRILGLDTANGSILWSLELPEFHRFNMPRDCSNWCADEKYVYAAMRGQCWRISASTGRVEQFYDVVAAGGQPFDWGYVSAQDDLIVGSAVRPGTSWTDYHGSVGWYDAKTGPQTAKVCSDNLFALDLRSGRTRWAFSDGLIINPTITIADGRVFFVQSRGPAVHRLTSRRIQSPALWDDLTLTALDLRSGQQVWQQPIRPAAGTVTFYLAHSDRLLVLVSSADGRFHTYACDADSGKPRWHTSLPWAKDNHGGHMSRPAIVGGKVYVRPHVMDLSDGEVLPEKVPGGGCGTYACTDRTLIFRAGTVTIWDRQAGTSSTWKRLRPDCWLSTIPADGMLLSPEGGGGCSCGIWMETSVVLKPAALVPGSGVRP